VRMWRAWLVVAVLLGLVAGLSTGIVAESAAEAAAAAAAQEEQQPEQEPEQEPEEEKPSLLAIIGAAYIAEAKAHMAVGEAVAESTSEFFHRIIEMEADGAEKAGMFILEHGAAPISEAGLKSLMEGNVQALNLSSSIAGLASLGLPALKPFAGMLEGASIVGEIMIGVAFPEDHPEMWNVEDGAIQTWIKLGAETVSLGASTLGFDKKLHELAQGAWEAAEAGMNTKGFADAVLEIIESLEEEDEEGNGVAGSGGSSGGGEKTQQGGGGSNTMNKGPEVLNQKSSNSGSTNVAHGSAVRRAKQTQAAKAKATRPAKARTKKTSTAASQLAARRAAAAAAARARRKAAAGSGDQLTAGYSSTRNATKNAFRGAKTQRSVTSSPRKTYASANRTRAITSSSSSSSRAKTRRTVSSSASRRSHRGRSMLTVQ